MKHDVWVEVDLSALKHNFEQVRRFVRPETEIIAVVKANGYGHGYFEPSRAFLDAGADALAVTRIEEALTLRNAGIAAPILVLAPIQSENAETAVEARLEVTVASVEHTQAMSDAASRIGKTASVHVKIDTGMGRLGAAPQDATELVEAISKMPAVHISGVFTHFAAAFEADISATRIQLEAFRRVLENLRSRGLSCGKAHAANSAAILRLPKSHLDVVRPGTILYGLYPSKHVPRVLDLRPAFKLKACICQVRELPRGARVGYGGEFMAKRPIKTAVVPVGWADGFTLTPEGPIYRQDPLRFVVRRMKRRLFAEAQGRKIPVIGRIAMQMTVLDVTGLEVNAGDEVTLPAMRIPVSPDIPRIYVG